MTLLNSAVASYAVLGRYLLQQPEGDLALERESSDDETSPKCFRPAQTARTLMGSGAGERPRVLERLQEAKRSEQQLLLRFLDELATV